MAERVEDILPILTKAIERVAESEKAMVPDVADRV